MNCFNCGCFFVLWWCGWFGGISGLIMEWDYESNVYFFYYDGDLWNNVFILCSIDFDGFGGV